MTEPLVDLERIEVRIGSASIITSATIRLTASQVVCVTGANGVGKTTLLRTVATLQRPSGGRGDVLGAQLGTADVYAVRSRIGMSGHHPALVPELTLAENLDLVTRLAGGGPRTVDEALQMAGLAGAARRRADRCSHGMQRRIDLARLWLTDPELLLLDEPHAGLDTTAEDLVSSLISSVRRRGGAALLASNDAAELAGVVDAVLTMTPGVL